MKPKSLLVLTILLCLIFSTIGASAQIETPNQVTSTTRAIGTGFVYQGQLQDGGTLANGIYDFQFSLWDDRTAGTQIGMLVMLGDVQVTNGIFAVDLDFGASPLQGEQRYLNVAVRKGDVTTEFIQLNPRQELKPVPYSLYADHTNSLSASDGDPLRPIYVDNDGMLHVRDGNAGQGRIVLENQVSGQWAQFNRWTNRFEILVSDGIQFATKEVGATKMAITTDGNVGIGTTEPQAKLDVNGTTRTQSLEIIGGSDLAELFEVTGQAAIEVGMVVAIDPNHPGHLRVTDQAYDKTIAGVVSGAGGIAPGLILQQQGTIAAGSYPVALTGRVYVWADSTYGEIRPGDLLTTSETPGHAMKVIDNERASNAILGKAMTKLDKGKGLVLVLISLQ